MLGDLTGSVATAPTIAAGAITLAKMANLSGTSNFMVLAAQLLVLLIYL